MRTPSIKESQFYDACTAVDEISTDVTNLYFPTVEELKSHNVTRHMNKYLYLLIYYAGDPYKDSDAFSEEEYSEYKRTVEYANNLIENIKFADE